MDLAHRMLLVTSMIAAPLLLIALIAGLVIGMLQAATQINESTLSFIPKLLLLVLTGFLTPLALLGSWVSVHKHTRAFLHQHSVDDRLAFSVQPSFSMAMCPPVGGCGGRIARRRLRSGGADSDCEEVIPRLVKIVSVGGAGIL